MTTNVLRDNNKTPEGLQVELASYGLMRQAAKDNAPSLSGTGPQYFGMAEDNNEYKLYFTNDLRRLDKQDVPMKLAIVAPDNESFDLLAPKDYAKGFSLKDESSLRRYLSNLLDAV